MSQQVVINKEIQLYQEVSRKIELKKVWTALEAQPNPKQLEIIESFDNDESKNSYVLTIGRRGGKSFQASIIAIRELLIPFSSTVLLCPTYRNAEVLFNATLKLVQQLGLPIAKMNRNQFSIELENGAVFAAFSESNIEAALGRSISLFLVDEIQSIKNFLHIYESMISAMFLDYGVRESGILYTNTVIIGTPRGKATEYYEIYLYEETRPNWVSFNAPSSSNPLLPLDYIESQRAVLSDRAFREELLGEWLSTGTGVFHAFNPDLCLYDKEKMDPSGGKFICGLDFGARDSTALVIVYVSDTGDYYVDRTYMANSKTTAQHYKAFYTLESQDKDGRVLGRYADPSAAQNRMDLSGTYNYDTMKAFNKIDMGIRILNNLFESQGLNKRPKLFINKDCKELITQVKLISWKNSTGQIPSDGGDPFVKHKDHHFDYVAALRYAVATHYRQTLSAVAVISSQ